MLYKSFEKKACEIERLFYFALKNALTKTGENRKINRTDILFYFKAGEMMSTGKERKRAGIYRLCLLVMLILLLGAAVPVSAKVTSVKNIEKVTGGRFTARNGNWYYYDKDGQMAKDCLLSVRGKTYYFSAKGVRQYSWHKIGTRWYYFGKKSEGYMYKNAWIYKNGKKTYYLRSDGRRSQGWIRSRYTYYFDAKGKLTTGTKRISGVNCRFDSNGRMTGSGPSVSISSPCGILVEADTGKVLYSKNPDLRHANASTTKLMTAILALEKCKLTEKVTASANAAAQEPTKLYLQQGESFVLKDLLYSLLIPSHNDTAVALAEHVSGSVPKFVKLMNKKAAVLGCRNTHFATPNGLDAGMDHYTTARDLAKIACYAWKKPMIRKIVKRQQGTITSLNGNTYTFRTTNKLLGNMDRVYGIKTGYTRKAGHCFVGMIQAGNGKTYISVTLGGPTSDARWADTRRLLQYADTLK